MTERIRVRTARIEAGITQKEAAEKLQISRWTYKDREAHPHKFTMGQAQELSKLVNRRMDELLFLPDDSTFVDFRK
ncbi:MAG: helix-turn-helix transcriptional regulator [Clostridiales bacterium]|nr:helix-turn-helix transcriptional regulator [Clostridiales bacterium]